MSGGCDGHVTKAAPDDAMDTTRLPMSPNDIVPWLDAGGDPTMTTERHGFTLLHIAVQKIDSGTLVRRLVVAGTPVDRPSTTKGQTPLHLAVVFLHHEAATALLAAGADPAAKDHAGTTPLRQAVDSGHRSDGRRWSPTDTAIAFAAAITPQAILAADLDRPRLAPFARLCHLLAEGDPTPGQATAIILADLERGSDPFRNVDPADDHVRTACDAIAAHAGPHALRLLAAMGRRNGPDPPPTT